jgi:hypothetical protein
MRTQASGRKSFRIFAIHAINQQHKKLASNLFNPNEHAGCESHHENAETVPSIRRIAMGVAETLQ